MGVGIMYSQSHLVRCPTIPGTARHLQVIPYFFTAFFICLAESVVSQLEKWRPSESNRVSGFFRPVYPPELRERHYADLKRSCSSKLGHPSGWVQTLRTLSHVKDVWANSSFKSIVLLGIFLNGISRAMCDSFLFVIIRIKLQRKARLVRFIMNCL